MIVKDRRTLTGKIGKMFIVLGFHSLSQNMRRHNAKDEYKPHGGRRRKYWIETPISKLIFYTDSIDG